MDCLRQGKITLKPPESREILTSCSLSEKARNDKIASYMDHVKIIMPDAFFCDHYGRPSSKDDSLYAHSPLFSINPGEDVEEAREYSRSYYFPLMLERAENCYSNCYSIREAFLNSFLLDTVGHLVMPEKKEIL